MFRLLSLYRPWLCLLLLTGAFSLSSSGQSAYFKEVIFNKEKKNAPVKVFFMDRRGLVWVGTGRGLCRYNGLNTQYFDGKEREVSAIEQDAAGSIWVGCRNGTIYKVKPNDSIEAFNPEEGLPAEGIAITAFLEDKQGRIWFSTEGEGLYCWDQKRLYLLNEDDGLCDNQVHDICLAKDGTVWAATDRGVAICSFINGRKVIRVLNSGNGLPDNYARVLQCDKDGNIWIGQGKGFCYYERATNHIVIPGVTDRWKYSEVNALQVNDKDVWIGTNSDGLFGYDIKSGTMQPILSADKTGFGKVNGLTRDAAAHLWVIASNKLYISNGSSLQFIDASYNSKAYTIKALLSDKNGQLWFSNRMGLFRKDLLSGKTAKVLLRGISTDTSIKALYQDVDGYIWMGTFDNINGVYRYNPATGETRRYTSKNGLVNDNVIYISGNEEEVWFATLGGASRCRIDDLRKGTVSFTNFSSDNGLSDNYIYTAFIDSKKRVWFATFGSGVNMLANGIFTEFANIPGLERNTAYSITEDIYGNIWLIGTGASGLFLLNGKGFESLAAKPGFRDQPISAFRADKSGNILFTQPGGFGVYHVAAKHVQYYGTESGMAEAEVQEITGSNSGAIYFATDNHIVRYLSPAQGIIALPPTIITRVLSYYNPIDITRDSVFNYNQNQVSVEFAGLWYMNPEELTYQYKLEGFNKVWVLTKDHIIPFQNLPAGKYVFKVKASVNGDFTNAPIAAYTFFIRPPFWKTWWFVLLTVASLGLLIYFVVRTRVRRLQEKQAVEREKLSLRFETLKSQVNPHFLFNSFNTLINIIEKDPPMAVEFTEQLSDFYREILLLQEKEETSLEDELKLLQHYIYLQQKRFGDSLRLVLDIPDMYNRYFIPPLTLQLLAENTLKHNIVSRDYPLTILIKANEGKLEVSNNINKKVTVVQSTGLGLKNIQSRIKMIHGGDITVLETDKSFTVVLPLIVDR
jgi:ligand-binding sensor domain-containing protein